MNTGKKLTAGIVSIIILSICLAITTAALVYSMVSVEGNLFTTGTVDINLNDNKPVINEKEFLFEPGMTVEKEFFIRNEGTAQVYYKIYLQNVTGGLAEVLEITLSDGENVLFIGTAEEFVKDIPVTAESILDAGETKTLKISFHFPEDKGNETQNLTLAFDIAADAVQTKNNPNRLFD